MSNSKPVTPTSLAGLKRSAKALKRDSGIQYVKALDAVAQRAGFSNYKHAQRSWVSPDERRHAVYLTTYWLDREVQASGRETLRILLQCPLADLITANEMRLERKLHEFRIAGPDHLQCSTVAQSQEGARDLIEMATRTLQFIDATGLRPVPRRKASAAYSEKNFSKTIPGEDHATTWWNPGTGAVIQMDEPYCLAIQDRTSDRERWALENGFNVDSPNWGGIWSPSATKVFLISKRESGVPIAPLLEALNKLPPPAISWEGESGSYRPIWMSPGTSAEDRKLRPPRDFGAKLRRSAKPRPEGRMSIEAHTEIGTLLREAYGATYYRRGVRTRVDRLRAELDE